MPWPPTEWRYAPAVRRTQTDDSSLGHGSCVASKAAGWKDGVSKNSRLVIMKSSLTIADQHWAFSAALDDIVLKRRQRRAVILYPRASTQAAEDIGRGEGGGPVEMWIAVKSLIDQLGRETATLTVVPAGNFVLRSKKIDAFPGIWASNSDPLSKDAPDSIVGNNNPSLLAVGSITNSGSKAPSSQGQGEPFLRFAPGEEVRCAGGEPSLPAQVDAAGTSFAAAMVIILLLFSTLHISPSKNIHLFPTNTKTPQTQGRRPNRLHPNPNPLDHHHRPDLQNPNPKTLLHLHRREPDGSRLERVEWCRKGRSAGYIEFSLFVGIGVVESYR